MAGSRSRLPNSKAMLNPTLVFAESEEYERGWTTGNRTQSDAEPLLFGVGDGRDMEGFIDEVYAYSCGLSEGEVAVSRVSWYDSAG